MILKTVNNLITMTTKFIGRGHKAPYKTSMIRCPDPIKPKIHQLIQDYRDHVESADFSYRVGSSSPLCNCETSPVFGIGDYVIEESWSCEGEHFFSLEEIPPDKRAIAVFDASRGVIRGIEWRDTQGQYLDGWWYTVAYYYVAFGQNLPLPYVDDAPEEDLKLDLSPSLPLPVNSSIARGSEGQGA